MKKLKDKENKKALLLSNSIYILGITFIIIFSSLAFSLAYLGLDAFIDVLKFYLIIILTAIVTYIATIFFRAFRCIENVSKLPLDEEELLALDIDTAEKYAYYIRDCFYYRHIFGHYVKPEQDGKYNTIVSSYKIEEACKKSIKEIFPYDDYPDFFVNRRYNSFKTSDELFFGISKKSQKNTIGYYK